MITKERIANDLGLQEDDFELIDCRPTTAGFIINLKIKDEVQVDFPFDYKISQLEFLNNSIYLEIGVRTI